MEGGSFAGLAFGSYISVVVFHDFLTDREANSRTVVLNTIESLENSKNFILIRRLKTDAIVFH